MRKVRRMNAPQKMAVLSVSLLGDGLLLGDGILLSFLDDEVSTGGNRATTPND